MSIIQKYIDLSKKKQALASSGIILLFMAIFLFTVYNPATEKINSLIKDNKDLNDEIKINAIKAKHLDKLKVENDKLEEMLTRAKNQLPQEDEISALLKKISDLGASTDLNFLLWRPQSKIRKEGKLYIEIPVAVDIEGNFHSVGLFFDSISRIARIVNISNINMRTSPAKEGEKVKVLTSFTATAFALAKNIKKEKS